MQIIFLTLLLPLAHAGWFTSTPEESFLAAGKSGDVEVVKKWLKNEGNIDTLIHKIPLELPHLSMLHITTRRKWPNF